LLPQLQCCKQILAEDGSTAVFNDSNLVSPVSSIALIQSTRFFSVHISGPFVVRGPVDGRFMV
jgi:hypothetical protein